MNLPVLKYMQIGIQTDFFDLNEELGIINVDTVPFITDVTFTVPNSLTGYVTRLRVVMQENNDSIIGPCDSTYFDPSTVSFIGPIRGATEDYSLVVNTSTANFMVKWCYNSNN